MADLNPNTDPVPTVAQSSPPADELEQRLGLYQVFLKLYEHHRELLDEILDLESIDRDRLRGVWQYILAGVEADHPYLITNLLDGKSQRLQPPQHHWVIGRDRTLELPIPDKRLSRRHALIQYLPNQGFYLQDLDSTNGSYLNGEEIRGSAFLQDGDRVRLGSLLFIFFVAPSCNPLANAPAALPDQQLSQTPSPPSPDPRSQPQENQIALSAAPTAPLDGNEKETFIFTTPTIPAANKDLVRTESESPELSTAEKSDILDRFLNR